MSSKGRTPLDEGANVVITGGLGHIGASLAKTLSKNNRVTVVDSLLLPKTSDRLDGVEIIESDVGEYMKSLDRADYIFHFGEYSRVEQSLAEPALVLNNNLGGILPVLQAANRLDAKIVYSGSSTKFSDDGKAWLSTPYGFSKYINSEAVKGYCEWCNVDYVILYFNNVYGGEERGDGRYATVVAKFLHLARSGVPLTVTSPGTQRRSFTHIEDAVAAILLIGKFGSGDDYVIAPDEDLSISELANLISSDVIYLPGNAGNRVGGLLDNSKLKDLGWSATRSIVDYVKEEVSRIK